MATQVQYRRGTGSQNDAFTGALGEITVDTTNGTIRVHNGITTGGSNVATVTYVAAQLAALSANAITFGTSNVQIPSSNGNVRVNVAGTANVGVFSSTGLAITGDLSVTGNATLSGNILGDRIQNGTTQIDIQTQGGNANITVGGVSNVSVFSTGGVDVAGYVAATGNVTGANVNTAGQVVATGNVSGGNLNITGNIVDTGGPISIITTSNGNINLSPNGTGNVNITGNVMPGANATANIGSATLSFNTIFAKATSAQYADLAELYASDEEIAPGTVVEFGGLSEVRQTTISHSTAVAGVVSTNPSYLMNSTLDAPHTVAVALTGRVPCRVTGTINKGDRLVASDQPGVATVLDNNLYQPGCIIGKALEDYNGTDIGQIEVAVGRF